MIVYTGGTFETFHAGHVSFLAACRKIAGPTGTVIVALNTDMFVMSYKGHAPVCSYAERATVLKSCQYVDAVIENKGDADSKPAITSVGPDVVAIGTDWATKDYYAQMQFTQEWLDSRGITLVYIAHKYSNSISTTVIKERIRK